MANETTSTTLEEIVMSEFIDPLIMSYLMDELVIAPLCYTVDISAQPTLTAAMTRWIKDAGADVTEGNDLSNTALETEENTATASTVGILREVTDLAVSANNQGQGGLEMFIAQDGAQLLAEMLDDDLAALFPSIATSVGSSGTDLTIANMVTALSSRRTNNARGDAAFVLDDQQTLDLTTAIAGSSAQIFSAGANQSLLNGRSDGFLGQFLGTDVWYTNLTDTMNTGANVAGCLFTTAASPSYATFGIALKWAPRMKSDIVVGSISTEYAVTAAYGVTERQDLTGVLLATDA